MKRSTITGLASTAAAVVALAGGAINYWPTVGWATPNQVAAKYAAGDHKHSDTIDALNDFRDEWKCDEYDEELLDLRQALVHAETEQERTRIEHDIERLRRKMVVLECSRFDDFG